MFVFNLRNIYVRFGFLYKLLQTVAVLKVNSIKFYLLTELKAVMQGIVLKEIFMKQKLIFKIQSSLLRQKRLIKLSEESRI